MKKILFVLTLYAGTALAQSNPDYSIYGVFNAYSTNYYDSTNTTLLTNKSACAYFSQSPTEQIFILNRDSAGIVLLNGQIVSYQSGINLYANNNVTFSTSALWEISGNGTISAMSFIYDGEMPSFEITNSIITDTLVKSDTLFIHLNGLANADSISVEFLDDSLGVILHRSLFIAPNYTDTYYIVPEVYQILYSGLRAFIKIEAINYAYQTISGKQFLFRNVYGYAKPRIAIRE